MNIFKIHTSKQIAFAPENPEYELMVFTDIDCGYCRKLHAQVPEYNENGISIPYPQRTVWLRDAPA